MPERPLRLLDRHGAPGEMSVNLARLAEARCWVAH
jgi:hypothetical protein